MSGLEETELRNSGFLPLAGRPDFGVHWAGETVVPEDESSTQVVPISSARDGSKRTERQRVRLRASVAIASVAVGLAVSSTLCASLGLQSPHRRANGWSSPPSEAEKPPHSRLDRGLSRDGSRDAVTPDAARGVEVAKRPANDALSVSKEPVDFSERIALEELVRGNCAAARTAYWQLAETAANGASLRQFAELIDGGACRRSGEGP